MIPAEIKVGGGAGITEKVKTEFPYGIGIAWAGRALNEISTASGGCPQASKFHGNPQSPKPPKDAYIKGLARQGRILPKYPCQPARQVGHDRMI